MNIVKLIQNKPDLITYSPASLDLIRQAEKDLNVLFAKDYVEYVSSFGIAVFDGHELTGICDKKRLDVVRNTKEERELNPFVPDDWYVVENAGIDGIIIWQDKMGRIYQTMPNGQKEYIADSLVEYLDKQ